jgi:hypothetical protein
MSSNPASAIGFLGFRYVRQLRFETRGSWEETPKKNTTMLRVGDFHGLDAPQSQFLRRQASPTETYTLTKTQTHTHIY